MLNRKSKLSSEAQIKIARSWGYFFCGSLNIAGHSEFAFANFNEFLRQLRQAYQVEHIVDENGDLTIDEIFLTDDVVRFIASYKTKVDIKPFSGNRVYPSELMMRGESHGYKY